MAEKTRTFSIYLLKIGFDGSNCLNEDHSLRSDLAASALPEGGALFVLDSPPSQPWWRAYFQVGENLEQKSKGAIVVLPVQNRHFALCFGHVQHNLVDESYVYDFGLKVTLNAVDPGKLKSTDTLEPGSSRRRRTQLPNEAELTLFDFDSDNAVLKSLTGKVKSEYEDYFKHPTGSSNLRIGTKKNPAEIAALCEQLFILYESDAYQATFPEIRSIEPLRDPAVLSVLNLALLESLKSSSSNVLLSVPEFIDYTIGVSFTFSGLGQGMIYDDIFIDRYYEYIAESGKNAEDLALSDLYKHKLLVVGENDDQKKSFSIFKSVVFETALAGSSALYHLNDGIWYKVESSLVSRLKAYLDPCCVVADLPTYAHANEEAYNIHVSTLGDHFVCLDRKNISPPGQKQIEPCDLLDLRGGVAKLIHVKISTQSASLSHLFNQGLASVELLRDDPTASDRMYSLILNVSSATEAAQFKGRFDSGDIAVQYAIVTHKDPANLSDNLPLFSRLSLARTLKTLNRMDIKRDFLFIPDTNPTVPGKKKLRKSKKAADADIVVEL
jgi:uncharacterized protein (TIGR04141 family)